MGLLDTNPPPKPTPPKEPYVSEKPYQGSEVDSERFPISTLLPYVKGSPWIVDYYRQLLRKDEESSSGQIGREAVYQQYQLIKEFELRVQSGFSPDFDEEKGEHSMSGTAIIYPSFKPIKGDTIIADLFDGRVGVIDVKAVRQKTIFADSTYEIDYEVIDFLTDRKKHELVGKVVKTTVFVRDFAISGQDPLVVEEEYAQIQDLRASLHVLQKQYFWSLYNYETATVPVPKQKEGTYDSFLIKFFDNAFPIQDRDMTRPLTRYIVEGDAAFKSKTFWDMLVEGSDAYEEFIVREFDCIGTNYLRQYPVINGIGFSRLQKVLYPKGKGFGSEEYAGPHRAVRHTRLVSPYSDSEWGEMELRYTVRRKILNGLGDVPPADLFVPLIHPVGIDDYYVLTEYFYSKAEYGQSHLELQTRAHIKGKKLHVPTLVQLKNDVPNWGEMERFYYIPLLTFLIRKAIGGF